MISIFISGFFDSRLYAISLYGNKKYKITLDGVARALTEMKYQKIIHRVINETIYKNLNLLAS